MRNNRNNREFVNKDAGWLGGATPEALRSCVKMRGLTNKQEHSILWDAVWHPV